MTKSQKTAILHFCGPQGSGKTTLARRLAELFGFPIFATSAVLSTLARLYPGEFQQPWEETKKGHLVPDEVVIKAVRWWLVQQTKLNISGPGLIFDGACRRPGQTKSHLEYLAGLGYTKQLVIWLDLPHEVCLRRMEKQGPEQRRADNTPAAREQRLAEYYEHRAAVRQIFEGFQVPIVDVSATPPLEEVFGHVRRTLDGHWHLPLVA